MHNLLSSLEGFAIGTPHSTALVDGLESINYQELWVRVNTVADALSSLKLETGDRIAVVASKRINTVGVILGALRIGAIVVPINPVLKPAQVAHILNDSKATLLFAPDQALSSLEDGVVLCPSIRGIVSTDSNVENKKNEHATIHASVLAATKVDRTVNLFPEHLTWTAFLEQAVSATKHRKEPEIDLPACILYTSGSTGQPKGVVLTHANLAYGAASVSQYLGNVANDRILALLPLSFDYGLSQLTSAISVGACTVLFDYFLPRGVIDAITRYKITGLPAVPHVWDQLANLEWPDVPYLRYLTNTGGRMHESTSLKLTRKLPGSRLYLMYGFTEAFRSTYLPPQQLDLRPRSIGKAVPYASVLVVNESGHEVPPDTTGELIHSGPLVTAGYWNDPELTQSKFRPRYPQSQNAGELFAWSGDLVTRDEEGFLYFVSRRDEQVKLRGFRINPMEIEETIARCPPVSQVCVFCVPHPSNTIAAIAVFVSAEHDASIEVESFCRNHLPGYMVPDTLIQRDTLPVTPNNKIDRQQLKQTFQTYFQPDGDESIPNTKAS